MPRIQAPPRIVNSGQVAQTSAPRLGPEHFGADAAQGMAAYGKSAQNLGHSMHALSRGVEEMAYVDSQLRAQQDELDAIKLGGEYQGKVLELKESLRENPRWEEHEKTFAKGITDLQAEYLKNAPSGGTKARLNTMFARSTAEEVHKVRIDARKFAIENEKETFRQIQTDYASRSLEDPNLAGLHEQLLINMTARRVLTPKEAGDARIEFRGKQADAHMRTNPSGFLADQVSGKYDDLDITTRLKLGEQAQQKIDAGDRKREAEHKKVSEAVYQDGYSRALNKTLDSTWLQNALNNRDPYITPEKAKHLFDLQNKPGTGAEDKAIAALQLEYRSGPTSAARVNKYRAQAQQLMSGMTEPNPSLSKFFDELMSDERTERGFGITLQGQGRAEKSFANAMTNFAQGQEDRQRQAQERERREAEAQKKKDIDAAITEFRANAVTLPGPIFQNIQKRKEAKIENDINKGAKPADVLKEALSKSKTATDKIPDKRKKIMDLAK